MSVKGGVTNEQATTSYSPLVTTAASLISPWAFWGLGLLNNSSFVIMVACAKSISEGGTALIFLSNSLPGLLLKISSPYWFDRVSYRTRHSVASLLMTGAFIIVASFASSHPSMYSMIIQLIGVAFVSLQCGMGEASLLALAGKCDVGRRKKACLTAFSSGTGVAGLFGFLWKFMWNDWLGLSLSLTLYLAVFLALSYWIIYVSYLRGIDTSDSHVNLKTEREFSTTENKENIQAPYPEFYRDELEVTDDSDVITSIRDMGTFQRLRAVLDLWPYMIPLYTVYFAEYALQAGTWTAIGFPVDDQSARDQFYLYSNWMYQFGVFLSRSSGTLYTAPISILWLMPALQSLNVAFFWWVAKYQIFYNYFLLIPAFYVGLLGGAVYINGYTRICVDVPLEHREFALSSTSVAEGLGIVTADVVGLFLQACLYKIHHLGGAVVSCTV